MPNFIEENWNKISDFRQSQALPVCDDTKCVCVCVCDIALSKTIRTWGLK